MAMFSTVRGTVSTTHLLTIRDIIISKIVVCFMIDRLEINYINLH